MDYLKKLHFFSNSYRLVGLGFLCGMGGWPVVALAGIMDYIREYDLNDYALGLQVSVSEQPYTNLESSDIAYPVLTSFRNAEFTRDWLYIDDGNVGFRWINDKGLVLGAVGRVQTLGLGSNRPAELIGLDERNWSWELAPMVGWRAWPVHFDFRSYKEVFGKHGGLTSEFNMTYPMEWNRGYLVPRVSLKHNNDSFMDYYYGVSQSEANPDRPFYDPEASTNVSADIAWGYRLSELWLLSGRMGIEWLGDEITGSPIVDKDSLWSFSLGLSYNANVFSIPDTASQDRVQPRFEIQFGIFQDNNSTQITRNNSDGLGGETVDLEDFFGIADKKSLGQVNALYRINRHHRLQLGFFNLGRVSETTLQSDFEFGDSVFAEGDNVRTDTSTRVTRLTYGYALINDAQKEVGVLAGMHLAELRAEMVSQETGERESVRVDKPLPVIGAFGKANLTEKLSVTAQLEFFRMQFDNYEGSINQLKVAMEYQLLNSLAVGLGYDYYNIKITSPTDAINGELESRHSGPLLYFGLNF